MPQPGTIASVQLPSDADTRIDTHVRAGSSVTPYYDSLIAKLIVRASTRAQAIARMERALGELHIQGIVTNIDLQRAIMRDPRFAVGCFNTRFLETMPS